MIHHLLGLAAFAGLFALFGLYGLLRGDEKPSCGGNCGACTGACPTDRMENHDG